MFSNFDTKNYLLSKCWPIFKMLSHFKNFTHFKLWPELFKMLTICQDFDPFSRCWVPMGPHGSLWVQMVQIDANGLKSLNWSRWVQVAKRVQLGSNWSKYRVIFLDNVPFFTVFLIQRLPLEARVKCASNACHICPTFSAHHLQMTRMRVIQPGPLLRCVSISSTFYGQ